MKNFILTDTHRKKSNRRGHGIQYLPGHVDHFVDHCVKTIARRKNTDLRILEIGGGGLRFVHKVIRIPNVKKVYIIEPDYYALDYKTIFSEFAGDKRLEKIYEAKAVPLVCNVESFIDFVDTNFSVDYICAFRVFHFFNTKTFTTTMEKICRFLVRGGKIYLSGLSPYENQSNKKNFLYRGSVPVKGSEFHRKLNRHDPKVSAAMREQNLQQNMLFLEHRFLDDVFGNLGLEKWGEPIAGTKVTKGYCYVKKQS